MPPLLEGPLVLHVAPSKEADRDFGWMGNSAAIAFDGQVVEVKFHHSALSSLDDADRALIVHALSGSESRGELQRLRKTYDQPEVSQRMPLGDAAPSRLVFAAPSPLLDIDFTWRLLRADCSVIAAETAVSTRVLSEVALACLMEGRIYRDRAFLTHLPLPGPPRFVDYFSCDELFALRQFIVGEPLEAPLLDRLRSVLSSIGGSGWMEAPSDVIRRGVRTLVEEGTLPIDFIAMAAV